MVFSEHSILFYHRVMDSDKAAMVENSDDDIEEVEEEEEGSETLSKEKLTAAVLQNPKVMAALQARLDSMVGDPSGYIKVIMLFILNFIHRFLNCMLIIVSPTNKNCVIFNRVCQQLSRGASKLSRISS